MLKRFLARSRAPEQPVPSVPPGMRVYAIGDVHGCRDELATLFALIDADAAARGHIATTTTIFLGDLIDRGPDSAGVIDSALMRASARAGCRFLKGNHEEVFELALAGDREALKLFCRIGGRETLLSYGLSRERYEAMDYDEVAAWLGAHVPKRHRAFIKSFEEMVIVGDYAFVHAGVRPGVPLDAQRPADLRWIREPFLSHAAGFEMTIVHGHSIAPDVDRAVGRIGIDTGAFDSGRLTALGLEGDQQWILSTCGR